MADKKNTLPTARKHWYLSGPMSGIPELNYPAFKAAAETLRALGATVVSPHEIVPPEAAPWSWEDHMRADLAALLTCEVMMLLPGWEQSRGATLERSVAEALGMLVVEYDWIMGETATRP